MGGYRARKSGSLPSPDDRVRITVTEHVRVRKHQRGLAQDVREMALDALRHGRYSETRPGWTFWKATPPRGWSDFQDGDLYVWDADEQFCLVLNGRDAKTCLRRRTPRIALAA
jgi:hypothetical protein